ncbi:hypothetical protein LTR78_009036 [Recurvomyces mirabilis]|uniref:PLL-like beta propeller domain-containing protein n=1 Tax=Recurvomyces mirabilis TaxID=574656 RepID=A0AAE0TQ12_9PEZI|nr:hypothetical protein LTR78_009036 [Recurvomyces mirabilis]KAK5150436.1 hypothetical protein LTS14_010126 [Recurvomyces mirabilis]
MWQDDPRSTLATSSIVANSWGDQRIDVFGVAPNASIWHKFHTAQQFQPSGFENFLGEVAGTPSVVSWGTDRLDYFVVGKNGSVYHRFWNWQGSLENSSWVPYPYHEVLLGQNGTDEKFVSPVSAASWGAGRLDVVGLAKNGSYLHMYFDGSNWQGWEDFGGNFSSVPSVVAWNNTTRFDIFGTTTEGDILHKFWDGTTYSDWEKFDGPFTGAPTASTWGAPNLDLWAVKQDGTLYHVYWRGSHFGTENLGGNFSHTPQVAHWVPGRIDLVGQFVNQSSYQYKYYEPNSNTWNGWSERGGDFVTQPAITSWADNQLNVLGVDRDGTLKWQLWVGEWLPGFDTYYSLGNTSDPFAEAAEFGTEGRQIVLGGPKEGL